MKKLPTSKFQHTVKVPKQHLFPKVLSAVCQSGYSFEPPKQHSTTTLYRQKEYIIIFCTIISYIFLYILLGGVVVLLFSTPESLTGIEIPQNKKLPFLKF